MEILAAVQPLVYTREMYQFMYDEDDPEEVNVMLAEDQAEARRVDEVLRDLYFLETDFVSPRDHDGAAVEIGDTDELDQLRRIAAAIHDQTPDDYWEGNVPPGTEFNHLINHATNAGYYLPVDFPQAFFVEETSIGSVVALLRELDTLEPVLAALFPDQISAVWALPEESDEPLTVIPELPVGPVRIWMRLRQLCRSAVALELPIQLS